MTEVLGPPPAHLNRHPRLGEWIEISQGSIAVRTGKVELGQGIGSAMALIAAEEMWVAPETIKVLPVSTDRSPNEDYTSGSFSVSQGGQAIRAAAAAARSILIEAAEARFGPDCDVIVQGIIRAGDQQLGYTDVLGPEALARTIVQIPLRGGPAPAAELARIDMPAKLAGAPAYLQDIVLPGMLHGRPVRPPGAPRRLLRFDDARAARTPHLIKIVRDGDFLGVIASREEAAVRAAALLAADCAWDPPTLPPAQDPDWLTHHARAGALAYERGSAIAPNARPTLSATYRKPYLAHASIGPSCALARTDEHGRLEVWSHTQGVFPLRRELAAILGQPEETIVVRHAEGAGCYGHNGAEDAALDSALLSAHVDGRPVRVQWSRADEFGNEPYGPAMQVRLEASLDETGLVRHWRHDVWSNGHTSRPGRGSGLNLIAAAERSCADALSGPMDPPLPYGGSLRNAVPLYAFPNVQVVQHLVEETPVRVSALRSLGAFANVFAIESFVDELAAAAGEDPLEFRLKHLDDPRAQAVLVAAADHVGFRSRSADGRALGLGFAQYKNAGAYCAAVAELDAAAPLGVGRLTLAVEAGRIVSHDGAANQIEGGAMQAASWTLKEAVPLAGEGRPRSWSDYPVIRFSEAPRIEVILLDRPDLPSVGVGECAQGPVAAAIANAFSAGFEMRVRDLPISRERVLEGMTG
jgi:nicotinate dehydrogenase subunit B